MPPDLGNAKVVKQSCQSFGALLGRTTPVDSQSLDNFDNLSIPPVLSTVWGVKVLLRFGRRFS